MLCRVWLYFFPSEIKYANKFRYRNVCTPSRLYWLLLILGTAFTVLVSKYGDSIRGHNVGRAIVEFNEFSKREALAVDVALPWVIGAMLPFSIAATLAWMTPNHLHFSTVRSLYSPLDFDTVPDNFLPDKWLNRAVGVRLFFMLGDILCAKVGSSITGTVFGICVYLLLIGQPVVLVTVASFALSYALNTFPKWARSIHVRGYASRLGKAKRNWRREFRCYDND